MTEITLDKSDPAINELIGGWQDGSSYSLDLKQVKTDGTKVTFQVEDSSTEEAEEEADYKSKKDPLEASSDVPPKHKNPALMVLIGGHKQ